MEQQLRLLDRLRDAVRARHYSPRTAEAYANWVKIRGTSHLVALLLYGSGLRLLRR